MSSKYETGRVFCGTEKGISVRGKWQGILIMKDWKGRGRHDTMTGGTHEFQKRDGYIIY